MFDDFGSGGEGDDERFDRLIDGANAALAITNDEAIGEAEAGIVGDMCDAEFMTVDEVANFIRADRANRATMGIPSSAL